LARFSDLVGAPLVTRECPSLRFNSPWKLTALKGYSDVRFAFETPFIQ
jgi:hypothetical protein